MPAAAGARKPAQQTPLGVWRRGHLAALGCASGTASWVLSAGVVTEPAERVSLLAVLFVVSG
jgi:hypothetical protein